jgi:plastocyanin
MLHIGGDQRRWALPALTCATLAITAAAAAFGIYRSTSAQSVGVSIGDDFYSPQNVVVQLGGTVSWTNNGGALHTVTNDDRIFDSGTLAPGSGYSFTFTALGIYGYNCEIHGAAMSGTVSVVGTTQPPTAPPTQPPTAPPTDEPGPTGPVTPTPEPGSVTPSGSASPSGSGSPGPRTPVQNPTPKPTPTGSVTPTRSAEPSGEDDSGDGFGLSGTTLLIGAGLAAFALMVGGTYVYLTARKTL